MIKKKLVSMIGVAAVAALLLGCGDGNPAKDQSSQQNTQQISQSEEQSKAEDQGGDTEGSSQESSQESSQVSGVIDELKDSMFVLSVKDGEAYYAFDKSVTGADAIENFQVGDAVVITYIGTLTEVDSFDGEIISIEKQS